MEEQKEHKRRVRYKGTHPRNYNEKYKELNPEKYQGTIEHVIQKGSTPAAVSYTHLVPAWHWYHRMHTENRLSQSFFMHQQKWNCTRT